MFVIPAAQALTVAELETRPYESPDATLTGITCGLCSKFSPEPVKHASVALVRYCYAQSYDMAAQIAAEQAAERATERYFEDRGAYYAGSREECHDRHVEAYGYGSPYGY